MTWYIGSIALGAKSASLLTEANTILPGHLWIWTAIISGIIIGLVKAKFLFSKSCKKNLDRIDAIDNPKFWQFFRPGFFLFLSLMILTGATLSRMASQNFPFLIGVGILDLSLSIGLLTSSWQFWITEK